MLIKKISGANIASLSEAFTVDLTVEPLRSSGLFAITGETGAGKSSILDAMCLALYGDCPRLTAEGVNDDLQELEGDPIKAKDPRSILRRGAPYGTASVEFVAPDGKSYEASWSVRRARGKVDGRLQGVERCLKRLEDDVTLENQITTVRDKVIELTGLTYDQFRRTALLAQGDFDAFLKAGTQERAALLEKVTGTALYREISRRVYDLCGEAKSQLDGLELRLQEKQALPAEQRDVLLEEKDRLTSRLEVLKINRQTAQEQIARHQAVTTARQRVSQYTKLVEEARLAVEGAREDRQSLAQIEKALQLQSAFDALDHARKSRHSLVQRRDLAVKAEKEAVTAVALKQSESEAADRSCAEAEDRFKSFGPLWTRATTLDGQIETARIEATKAASHLEAKRAEVAAETKACDTLKTSRDAARSRLDTAAKELERLPQAGRFAEQWDHISRLIDERMTCSDTITRKTLEKSAAVKLSIEKSKALNEIKAADELGLKRMAEIKDKISSLTAQINEIATIDPNDRLLRLERGSSAVKEMRKAATGFSTCKTRHNAAEVAVTGARKAHGLAQAGEAKLKPEIEALTTEINALQKPLDLAEAAASDVAAALRQKLQDDEPCPVCGSCEHPDLQDEALGALARQMRQDIDSKRSSLAAAERDITQLRRDIDRAQGQIDTGVENIAAITAELRKFEDDFAAARIVALETGMKKLPDAPGAAETLLDDLQEKIGKRRIELQDLTKQDAQLQAEVKSLQLEKDRLQSERDSRQSTKENLHAEMQRAQSEAGLADERTNAASARHSVITEELTPALTLIGRDCKIIDDDSKAAQETLSKIVSWWRRQTDVREQATLELTETASKLAAAETSLNLALVAEEQAQASKIERAAALGTLTQERSQLLDGEATEVHRTRHNNIRLAAIDAKQSCALALSEARATQTAAKARLEDLQNDLAVSENLLETRQAAFTEGCAKKGLDPKQVADLLLGGHAKVETLRARIKKLDDAFTSAQSGLLSRQADLEVETAKGIPEDSEADLAGRLLAIEAEEKSGLGRKGEIAQIIAADDALLVTIRDLRTKVDEAKRHYDTWSAVSEAVGSRSGSKFAQIAQAVTLSILVERANLHLQELKPRYQLMQGGEDLSLKIVDLDMGDDIRSTRSLSGGERFLVSLALALALSRMGNHGGLAATLFIDEGFGSLDAQSLDMAIDALETLQAQGRTVGVISHVDALKDRIPVQVKVVSRGNGASVVELA